MGGYGRIPKDTVIFVLFKSSFYNGERNEYETGKCMRNQLKQVNSTNYFYNICTRFIKTISLNMTVYSCRKRKK